MSTTTLSGHALCKGFLMCNVDAFFSSHSNEVEICAFIRDEDCLLVQEHLGWNLSFMCQLVRWRLYSLQFMGSEDLDLIMLFLPLILKLHLTLSISICMVLLILLAWWQTLRDHCVRYFCYWRCFLFVWWRFGWGGGGLGWLMWFRWRGVCLLRVISFGGCLCFSGPCSSALNLVCGFWGC